MAYKTPSKTEAEQALFTEHKDGYQDNPDMPFYPDDISAMAEVNGIEHLAYHNFARAEKAAEIRANSPLFRALSVRRAASSRETQ
jgi:hypothetical protein